MKVLMVTPSYYPILGGTESLIENLSLQLSKMGIHTDIMTFNVDQRWNPWSINQIAKSKIEKINGLNVIKIKALTLLLSRLVFKINFIPDRFIDQLSSYDILHFHNEIDLSFPAFSIRVDKPKIFHCHLLNISYNSYRRNPIQRYIFKKSANLYIVPSFHLLKLLVHLKVPDTRIKVVPNGIDVKKFYPFEKMRTDNLVLFVGRIHPVKGLHILLRALKYLKTRVKLVVIGRPSGRPNYFKKVLNLINRENEKGVHKITYLGPLEPEKIVKWYQKASIFVCPSLSESFGIANLEAMACATPVIATHVGGVPEVVKDYETGILVSPNNVVELSEAMQYLLDNEGIRKKFGREGRKWVVKNFSSEAVAQRICKIYEKMV
jgi:glycosyltransferase involved in cell wall biosynthesis